MSEGETGGLGLHRAALGLYEMTNLTEDLQLVYTHRQEERGSGEEGHLYFYYEDTRPNKHDAGFISTRVRASVVHLINNSRHVL